MSTSLPLLNLPPIVSEQVLQNMTLSDLFDLSQFSKRTFNLIKTFFKKIPSTLSVSINSTSEIDVANYDLETFGFTKWMFYEARDPARMDLENPRTYKVDGMHMEFCRTEITREDEDEDEDDDVDEDVDVDVEFGCLSEHSIQDLMKFCEHLMKLFNATVGTMYINCPKMENLEQLLSVEAFRTCRSVGIGSRKVTHEELRKILTGFDTKYLRISSRTKQNFLCNEVIRVEKLDVRFSSWINIQFLRNLDFKQGTFTGSFLTNEDLNSFLKHWLEGSNTRMEFLCVSGPLPSLETLDPRSEQPKWDLSKIVEGVITIPGAIKRADAVRYVGYGTVPYENGLDVKRESDGVLATAVLFTDVLEIERFLFEVWQVPDPNVVVDDE